MKSIKLFFLMWFILISCNGNNEKSLNKIDHDIYEMRVYYTYDGKFNDIISRFENHTTKLFEKHGFNNVGYWTTLKKDSTSILSIPTPPRPIIFIEGQLSIISALT